MENPERIKTPEIKSEELLRVLEGLKYESYEEFEYNGTRYLIILTAPHPKKEGTSEYEDAWFSESTMIFGGYDIYIGEHLQGDERRRKMFHEVAEANLRNQGFENEEAHTAALAEEEKIFGKRAKQK